jgi:hypothetical protein
MPKLLCRAERPTRSRTTSSRTPFTHHTIIDYRRKNRTSHFINFQNLTLQKRTCHEPLASTHPDTQGVGSCRASRAQLGALISPLVRLGGNDSAVVPALVMVGACSLS